jgi:hypothetical protein
MCQYDAPSCSLSMSLLLLLLLLLHHHSLNVRSIMLYILKLPLMLSLAVLLLLLQPLPPKLLQSTSKQRLLCSTADCNTRVFACGLEKKRYDSKEMWENAIFGVCIACPFVEPKPLLPCHHIFLVPPSFYRNTFSGAART